MYMYMMDYFALLNKICDKVDSEEETKDTCCDTPDIQIRDFVNVCVNCGVVVNETVEEENPFVEHCIKTSVFYPSMSYATTMSNTYASKHKSLQRMSKWSSHSSKDTEANKCYKLIETMLLNIIPNFKENRCLGEKILHKAKLYWKTIYYELLPNAPQGQPKSTRGQPRKCLFGFCIIKALEYLDQEFKLLDTLKSLGVNINKYNKVLKNKIDDEDKTFVNKQFVKYLEIINSHNPFITLEILIERYNVNIKNKINKSHLPKKQRINVNPSSLLKAISYDYIRDSINKQDACEPDILHISSLTLNKALKIIV